jgi:CheY-like chemotaxis protein
LIHLVTNARDAMPRGGELHIVTNLVRLDAMAIGRQRLDLDPGEYVEIRLTDTGTGMTPEVLARAFEPFFTTKGVGKGTGLGLPSAYGTVKQLGGHMGIDSALGRGTTITILLPRVAALSGSKATPVLPRGSGDGHIATILLVEDEATLRHLTARMLSGAGYSVLQAAGGDEAVACARQHPGEIDLVLSDVVMPGMSAVELMAALRVARPRAATLLMSGYPRDEILRRGVRSQDFMFLEKPFTAEALRMRVHVALTEHDRKGVVVGS